MNGTADEDVANLTDQEEEYDTGEDPFGNLFYLEPGLEPNQAEIPDEDQLSVYEQVEFLEIEGVDGAGATSPTTVKEEEEPLNLLMMSTSLNNDASNASDCIITAAYIVSYDSEDTANEK